MRCSPRMGEHELERAAVIANHVPTRTAQPYDRRLDEIERILI